jgi:hypothetical protein
LVENPSRASSELPNTPVWTSSRGLIKVGIASTGFNRAGGIETGLDTSATNTAGFIDRDAIGAGAGAADGT